jgi:hypothetical protein
MLKAGDRVDLPEDKARKLLDLAKGKVQMVNPTPLRIGDRVRYRIPTFDGDRHTGWKKHIGVVEEIDRMWHLVRIGKSDNRVWVSVAFVETRLSS